MRTNNLFLFTFLKTFTIMRKNLFILAAALAVCYSCSNDETVEVNQGNAISFRPFIDRATRASAASDVATTNITSFEVTAFNHGGTTNPYINAVTFNGSGSPKVFTSTNKYYWPTNNLDFYAWTVNSSESGITGQVSKSAYNSFVFTPATAANSTYADLVFATLQDIGKTGTYNNGAASYGANGVPLNFRHTASKIAVKVKNTSETLKFSVDGWKVGYLARTGTFTLSETSTAGTGTLAFSDWTNNTTKAAATQYSSTFDAVAIGAKAANAEASATALAGEMILVPQRITAATAYANSGTPAANDPLNGSFIAVKLKIMNNDTNSTVIADDGTDSHGTIWAIWPIGDAASAEGTAQFNWEPGKKYTYTIDLAGGGFYETNQNETTVDADLDPILEGAEIKFVSVTVDEWTDVAKTVPES